MEEDSPDIGARLIFKITKREIRSLFWMSIQVVFLLLFASLFIASEGKIQLSLLPVILIEGGQIIIYSSAKRKIQSSKIKKIYKYFIIEYIGWIIFQSLIIIGVQIDFSFYTLFQLPLCVVIIAGIYTMKCFDKSFLSVSLLIKQVINVGLSLTCLSISLKIDGIFSQGWILVFSPLWILLILQILIGLIFFVKLIVKVILSFIKQRNRPQILVPSLLFCLNILVGFLGSIVLYYIKLTLWNEQSMEKLGSVLLWISVAVLLVMILYAIYFFKIVEWCFFNFHNIVQENQVVQGDQVTVSFLKCGLEKPFELKKISNTYYVVCQKHPPQSFSQVFCSLQDFGQEKDRDSHSLVQSGSKIYQTNFYCLICTSMTVNAVYLPCGHSGLCYQCSTGAWKMNKECYICRQTITEILEIRISSLEDKVFAVSRTIVRDFNN